MEEEKKVIEPVEETLAEEAPVEESKTLEAKEPVKPSIELFKYNKEFGCLFYEKDKSWEDADPYLDETLLVVCDGSGGAGGFKHDVDHHKIDSFKEIKELVLPEDEEGFMDEYLKKLFAPIYEKPKDVRTSAFWASRIVIPRFVYYWKKEGHDINKAKDFILKGMEKVAKELHLVKSEQSDKGLLPTTFVAISIEKEEKDKISFDVYWAGDSRAYYFNPNGMRVLSVDNEDESGSITNLFVIKEGMNPKIFSKHYEMAKPCALLVCSDGLFDICNNIQFEGNFLALIEDKNINSLQEFSEALAAWYKPRKSDDCTLAMKVFGYNSFRDMKYAYKDRCEYVFDLFKRHYVYQDALAIRKDKSVYDNNFRRLVVRTGDKFDDIATSICDALVNEKEDPFNNEDIKEKVLKAYQEELDEKNKERSGVISEIVELVKKFIFKNYQTVDFYTIFDQEKIDKQFIARINSLLEEQRKINEIKAKQKRLDAMMRNDKEKKGEFISMIQQLNYKANKIRKLLYTAFHCDKGEIPMSVKLNIRIKDADLDKLLDVVNAYDPDPEFKEKFLVLFVEYKDLKNYLENTKMVDLSSGKKKEEIIQLLNDFFAQDEKVIYDAILREAPVEGLGELFAKMTLLEQEDSAPVGMSKKFRALFGNEEGYEYIVLTRLEAGNNKSVIDQYYNTYLLDQTLKYHRVLYLKDVEFEKFFKEYEEFNAKFNELLK